MLTGRSPPLTRPTITAHLRSDPVHAQGQPDGSDGRQWRLLRHATGHDCDGRDGQRHADRVLEHVADDRHGHLPVGEPDVRQHAVLRPGGDGRGDADFGVNFCAAGRHPGAGDDDPVGYGPGRRCGRRTPSSQSVGQLTLQRAQLLSSQSALDVNIVVLCWGEPDRANA